jgi:aspartyl-tRNA(Asn)/glutamyl-tRNA(Gln) amidotransferase subunit C
MVSEKDVSYVADLTHLELTEGERAHMLRDLNSILGYIERLNELDTSGIEPMAQVSTRYAGDVDAGEAFAYAMRPDELIPSLPREVAMSNTTQTDGTFFKVPKVIER